MSLIGMGLDVNGACSADVCNGVWGYNSLLTAAALGGYFVRFNFHSFLLSIIGAIVSGFMCAVLKKVKKCFYSSDFCLNTRANLRNSYEKFFASLSERCSNFRNSVYAFNLDITPSGQDAIVK